MIISQAMRYITAKGTLFAMLAAILVAAAGMLMPEAGTLLHTGSDTLIRPVLTLIAPPMLTVIIISLYAALISLLTGMTAGILHRHYFQTVIDATPFEQAMTIHGGLFSGILTMLFSLLFGIFPAGIGTMLAVLLAMVIGARTGNEYAHWSLNQRREKKQQQQSQHIYDTSLAHNRLQQIPVPVVQSSGQHTTCYHSTTTRH